MTGPKGHVVGWGEGMDIGKIIREVEVTREVERDPFFPPETWPAEPAPVESPAPVEEPAR